MADNTIDTLQLEIQSNSQRAVKALNSLSASLLGVQKAAKRMDASALTKFSSDLSSFARSMKNIGNVKLPDISNFANNMSKLKGIDLKSSGITNTVNALKRLSEVDTSAFDASKFSAISNSISQLAGIPDVSKGLNRFVSSLARLTSAGSSASIVASELPRLGIALESVVSKMAVAPQISESVNMFVQSIGRLASAGDKTGKTAGQLGALAQQTLAFFQTMEKAPQISSNTIQMTEALAQLASAGGKVGTASSTVSSAFNKLSSIGNKVSNTLKKAAATISNAFSRITKASSGLKITNINLATVLKTAIGFRAVQGFTDFGRSAIQLSSDLTEVQNVVDVTFGKMASKVEELAQTSIGDFGLSELTLKQISSRFQAMGVAMGFTQDKMSDMSLELTKLAADMASFYNVEQADVAKDLESIFTGQTRPLRTYGLDLTQATLQEWALKKGIDANVQSMSQQEKTMLRYQYVLENTSAAAGDFSRTAGTWANQSRILKQNFEQLAAVIGQGLIAAILPVVKLLNSLIAGFNKAAYAFRNFMYTLMGKKLEGSQGGITQDLGDGYEDAADGMDTATDSAKKLGKALSVLSFDELNQLSDSSAAADVSANVETPDSGSLGGYSDLVTDLADTDVETPINAWAKRIRDAFLKHDWQGLGFEIADGLNRGLQAVYDAISWNNVGPKIEAFTSAFTQSFNSLVDSFDWDLLGRTIGAGINTTVNTLNNLIGKNGIDFEAIGSKLSVGLRGLVDETEWENLGNLLGNRFMIFWNLLTGFVDDMSRTNNLTGLTGWQELGKAFSEAINGAFEIIDLGKIGKTISKLVIGILDFLIEAIETTNWEEVGKEIGKFLAGLNFKKIASKLGKLLWAAINAAIDAWKGSFSVAPVETALLSIIPIVSLLAPAIKTLASFGNSFIALKTGMSGFSDLLGPLTGIFGEGGLFGAGGAVAGASGPVLAVVAAVLALAAGLGYVFATNEDVRKSFSDAVTLIGENLKPLFEFFTDKVIPDLKSAWDGLLETLKPIGNFLKDTFTSIWQDILNPALSYFGDTVIPKLTSVFENLWNKILVPFGNFLKNSLTPVIGIISDVLSKLWKNIILPLAKDTGEILGKAFESVVKIFNNVVAPAVQKIIGVFNFLWKDVLTPVIDFLKKILSPVIDTVFKNIKSITDNLKTGLSGLIDFITGIFTGDWKKAWEGVKDIFKAVFNSFVGLVKSPINLIIWILNKLIDAVAWVVNKVGEVLNSLSFKIPDNIPVVGGLGIDFNFETWTPSHINYLAKGGLVTGLTPAILGEYGRNEAVLPLENNRTMGMIASSIMSNAPAMSGNDMDSLADKIASKIATVMMNNQQPVNVNCYAELKTENDEVLARAVTRGQQRLDYRNNATPRYGY